MSNKVNVDELTTKVKQMYRGVAEDPHAAYHFELGRPLAIRLGYDTDLLDQIPAGAVESFAGVGYFFDLADIARGETVVDLGSGSGLDAFYAAQLTGPSGRVIGVDFTNRTAHQSPAAGRGVRPDVGRVPRGSHRAPAGDR